MTTTGISRPDGATRVLTESTIISYLGLPSFTEDPFPAYRFFLDLPGLHETQKPVRHRYNRWPGLATMPVAWEAAGV